MTEKKESAKNATMMFVDLTEDQKNFILGYMIGVQQSKGLSPQAS